jgi:hypothetical protein
VGKESVTALQSSTVIAERPKISWISYQVQRFWHAFNLASKIIPDATISSRHFIKGMGQVGLFKQTLKLSRIPKKVLILFLRG